MMTDHQDSLLRYVVKRVFAVQSERFSGVQRKPLLALSDPSFCGELLAKF